MEGHLSLTRLHSLGGGFLGVLDNLVERVSHGHYSGQELGRGLFEEINRHLESRGLRLREGTIVDASIIEAPASTKNRAGERDPDMHQVKKGKEWHFGMKVHIGADADTGVVHSMSTTAANVHDVTEAHRLLHGGERRVWGDAGYQGVESGRRIGIWMWSGGWR